MMAVFRHTQDAQGARKALHKQDWPATEFADGSVEQAIVGLVAAVRPLRCRPPWRSLHQIRRKGTHRHRNKAFSAVAQKTLRPTFCLPTVTTGENFSARIVPG
jgi:hypothetical protein